MTQETEDVLRAALAGRAAQITSAPSTLAEDAMAEAGRGWRPGPAVVLAGAGASVIAVVLVATSLLTGSGSTPPAAPAPSAAASSSAAAVPTPLAYVPGYEPYPIGPRGELTGDPVVVQQLVERPWGSGSYFGPAVETRQLVFAGTVDGGGVQSLVIGRDGNQWLGWWTAGTSVEDLQVMGDAQPLDVTQPIVWSNSVGGVGALVVISAPGDEVSVMSPGFGADGTASSTWTPLPTTDGVATQSLDGASDAGSSQVRVTRDGAVVFEGGVQGSASMGGPPGAGGFVDPAIAAMDGARGTPELDVVRGVLPEIADPLQLSTEQLGAQVVWGGTIDGGGSTVAVVATVPSGAQIAAVHVRWPTEIDEGGSSVQTGGVCATQVFTADTDLPGTVLATRCDRYDLQGVLMGSTQVVVPPATTRTLRFLGAQGEVLGTQTVQDGVVWSGPLIAGLTTVEALDAAGTVVGSDPLMVDTDLYNQ